MRPRLITLVPAILAAATSAAASIIVPAPIPDRVRGADRVVVASVAEVTSSYETNEFGDELIVSRITLRVEEILKGRPETVLSMQMDGGTVGNVTLEVSSLPRVQPGERAVFFLKQNARGKYVPHLRGQGILKLESDGKVKGATSLTLDQIRQMAASAGR